jgi:hypothetical protein
MDYSDFRESAKTLASTGFQPDFSLRQQLSRKHRNVIRLTGPAVTFFLEVLRFAQDFGCGLPLRSRPHSASTYRSGCHCYFGFFASLRISVRRSGVAESALSSLSISAAGSRSAHARKAPQLTGPAVISPLGGCPLRLRHAPCGHVRTASFPAPPYLTLPWRFGCKLLKASSLCAAARVHPQAKEAL